MLKSKKKLLGQFFSGVKLGALLDSLIPSGIKFNTLADPMAGVGDLLFTSCYRVPDGGKIIGVEIDAEAGAICKRRIKKAEVVIADAFKAKSVCVKGGVDGIVANPPYVRYQLMKDNFSAEEVRKALKKQLLRFKHLSKSEQKVLTLIADGYSGTADLAVPSWILCAAMLSDHGWLGIVVPETWLSRDYAAPIQYMLAKLFDVRFVVRDIGASWFDDAQVRTCLVVAQRKPVVSLRMGEASVVRLIDLFPCSSSQTSLIENLRVGKKHGLMAWRQILNGGNDFKNEFVRARNLKLGQLFPGLNACVGADCMEEDVKACKSALIRVPFEIERVLPKRIAGKFKSLADWGINCGQGMRTGANEFFYLAQGKKRDTYRPRWSEVDYRLPSAICIPALKKRSDTASLVVNACDLKNYLLYLPNVVRRKDVPLLLPELITKSLAIDDETERLIDEAERRVVKNNIPVYELSAVRPNIRRVNQWYKGFWYQLPKLARRHCPELCIPRVNGIDLSCLYIAQDRRIVVDANFTTIWSDVGGASLPFWCYFNSLWFKCLAESAGTVMGGGALKLEANTIRKLPVPNYSKKQLGLLGDLAKELIGRAIISDGDQRRIDDLVLAPFGAERKLLYANLKKLLNALQSNRGV